MISVEQLFQSQMSNQFVTGRGTVDKILSDDEIGSRHQRFILRLESGTTILVAHNIDLSPRLPLEKGAEVEFCGEYEFNELGGIIHWTHGDPEGVIPGGWLKHSDILYQ